MRIRFEDCVFDSDTREVSRGGQPLSLGPKAFQMLEILIRERPKAVTKRQLRAELWPGVFVTEANLPNLITELRGRIRRPRAPPTNDPNRARFWLRVQRSRSGGHLARALPGRGTHLQAGLGKPRNRAGGGREPDRARGRLRPLHRSLFRFSPARSDPGQFGRAQSSRIWGARMGHCSVESGSPAPSSFRTKIPSRSGRPLLSFGFSGAPRNPPPQPAVEDAPAHLTAGQG